MRKSSFTKYPFQNICAHAFRDMTSDGNTKILSSECVLYSGDKPENNTKTMSARIFAVVILGVIEST